MVGAEIVTWESLHRWRWWGLAASIAAAGYLAWAPDAGRLLREDDPGRSRKPVAAAGPVPTANSAGPQAPVADALLPLPGDERSNTQAHIAAEKLITALGQEAVVDPSLATASRIELGRDARASVDPATAATADVAAAPQDTGLPIFPGAVAIAEQTVRQGADGQSVTAVLTTSAPAAQVVEFYRLARQGGVEGEVVRTLLPTAANGLDLREVNTRERIVYRIQVAPVEATVYIRLSRHRLP